MRSAPSLRHPPWSPRRGKHSPAEKDAWSRITPRPCPPTADFCAGSRSAPLRTPATDSGCVPVPSLSSCCLPSSSVTAHRERNQRARNLYTGTCHFNLSQRNIFFWHTLLVNRVSGRHQLAELQIRISYSPS